MDRPVLIASPRDGDPAVDGAAAPDAMFVLDGEAAAKFTEKVFDADGNVSSVLEAPRLLVNNLSLASMVTEEQIAYVRDWLLEDSTAVHEWSVLHAPSRDRLPGTPIRIAPASMLR